MRRRRRIAVLGGGCAGVAVAHALSRTTRARESFEVTVYEQSWRLGGKGATGRDPRHGGRIEEHGLHVWMGFYEHAFAAAREALAAWPAPPGCPLRTFDDAFAPRYGFRVGQWALRLPPRPGRPGDGDASAPGLADLLGHGISMLRGLADDAAGWLRMSGLLRLAGVVARGLAVERARGGDVWARVDEYDLRAWLRRHGAADTVANAAVIRAFYDMAFAYPDGVAGDDRGAVAAGAAIRSILRLLFTYRGAPMWLLRHGMGDTVFAPMHELLRARGVRFAFFHRTERLVPSPDARTIDAIEMRQTARGGEAYDPLLREGDTPVWPQAPLRARLDPQLAPRTQTLRRGDDFDEVVLAIPAGALPPILQEVARRHPRVASMLEHSHTVATKAAQLWTRDAVPSTLQVTTGGSGAFATAADLSEVLTAESWPEPAPRGLVYLVDTVPDDAATEAEVRGDVTRWLRQSAAKHLDHEARLVGPPYVRANVEPWERYVLSLPGTTKHRLRPDETGVANLRFAGDWVKTSIDGGSVEAAFESAAVAARSLGA